MQSDAPKLIPASIERAKVLEDVTLFDEEVAGVWTAFPAPEVPITDLSEFRTAWAAYSRETAVRATAGTETEVVVEDLSVPSVFDDYSIPVRVYKPKVNENHRGIVYIHGGSFVSGGLDFEDLRCRTLADGAGCVIVSVDYRLAPEHPFPVPLQDCYSALQWVEEHALDLSVDTNRLGIGGCSAGGALAASVAQMCCDRSGPALAMQMLLYPVLDGAMSSPTMRALPPDEHACSQLMWDWYLGARLAELPQYSSPAARRDLNGLPPAYILAAELDDLRDEAIAYAQRLLEAGVTVELHLLPRVPHAFEDQAPDTSVARHAFSEQIHAIARFLR